MKKRIAFAGTVVLDIIKKIDTWPDKGMLTQVYSVSNAVGGSVCNSGIDAKVLGGENVDVLALGNVGNDANGRWVVNYLSERGLDVSRIKYIDEPTAFTDVMTIQSTGERTFFTMSGASATFSEDDIDFDNLNCDIFHLGYLLLLNNLDSHDDEYGTKAARLLARIQANGIKTSIDIVSEQSDRFKKIVSPAVKYCNYVIINEIEGGALAGIEPRDASGKVSVENLKAICRAILDMGVKDSVTLHCPELSCAMTADGEFSVLPSLDLPKGYIVGSVGAGDAFCAGMLYALAHEMTVTEGMRIASLAAAANLSVADSVSGARSLEETLKLEKIYRRKEL